MKMKNFFAKNQGIVTIFTLIATLLVGFYISADVLIFRNPVGDHISAKIFIIGLVIYLLFLGLLFFLNSIERNRFKNFLPLGVCLGVVFIINIITTCVFKNTTDFTLISIDGNEYQGTYYVSNFEKFKYIVQFFIMCMNCYLGFVVIPQIAKTQKAFKIFVYIYIAFVIIVTITGYITEYQKYYNFFFNFTPQSVDGSTISPLGLYKNTFGFLLTLQIFCFIYLHNDNRKWYFIVMMFFALFNILVILCKLGLIISSIAIAIYLIYLLVDTWKKNPKRNAIIAIAVGGTIAVAALVVLILVLTNNPLINELFSKISKLFETKENTLFTRSLIWKNCFTIVKTHNAYLFGCGYGVTGGLLYEYNTIDLSVYYNHTTHAHNIWIEYYAYGGISLVILSVLLTACLIYAIVKIWKRNNKIAFFASLLILCSLIYGSLENYPIFFARSFESTLFGYLIVVPLMIEYYQMRNEPVKRENENLGITNLILSLVYPVLGIMVAIPAAHMIMYHTNFWLFIFIGCGVLGYIISSFIYIRIYKLSFKEYMKKRGLIHLILFGFGVLISILCCLLVIECDFATFIVALWTIVLCLLIALSINKTKELIFVK